MFVAYYTSPIGQLKIKGDENAIFEIHFIKRKNEKETPEWELGQKAKQQLADYFKSKRMVFDLPLNPQGTVFQQKVWKALQEIPVGKTATYAEIATNVGNPKASRAVGQANNQNPIAIVIPCHRVIGTNKKLTGYAGGLLRKDFLLNLEKGIQTIL